MPLHSDCEVIAPRILDRLDNAIFCPGSSNEVAADVSHRLMMR